MHCDIIDKIDSINNYKNIGVYNYRIELFDEDNKKIEEIIKRIKNN